MRIEPEKRLIKHDKDPDVLKISKATTIEAGGLTVSAGGAAITGNTTVTGTLIASSPVSTFADPGNGGTITPVANALITRCDVTTAGAGETRVLGTPSFVGQFLVVEHTTDGGDFTITIAAGHKNGGASDDVATFAEVNDCEVLVACGSAAADWRWVADAGVAFA